ncbi:MAG: hypothetical protein K6G57_01680 [Lachnospiraceae bacterium]|nr:hypothetical protein [Lachnospiraceae bacterium]
MRKRIVSIIIMIALLGVTGCGNDRVRRDAGTSVVQDDNGSESSSAVQSKPESKTDTPSGTDDQKEDVETYEEAKAEMEALTFLDDNDRKYLTPDTDDYRIFYVEIPEVTVFPGWGTSSVGNALCFCGISDGTKNERIPAKLIDVVSYDESGNFVSQKQKFWVDDEDDAMTLMYTEKFCAYFFGYETGVNGVPDDFDPDATVRYSTDTVLSRDVHEFTPDLTFVKRIGNVFYGQVDRDGYTSPLLASHIAYAGVSTEGSLTSADYADESGMIQKSIRYSFEADDDMTVAGFATRHIEYSKAEAKAWYSKADNHKKGLIRGKGDHFDGKFPEAVYEDGYVEEDKDAECFIPATDDYFLYYVFDDYSTEHNDECVLISFDENGDPKDIIMRFWKNTISPLSETISHYDYLGAELLYSDGEHLFYLRIPADIAKRPDSPFDDGWEIDTKLRRMSDFNGKEGIFCPYRGFMRNCHAYINDPTVKTAVLDSSEMIDFDPEEVLGETKLSSKDYIVVKEESVDNGEDTADETYSIYSFDKDGNIIDNGIAVYKFDTVEKAKRVYDILYDTYGESYKLVLNGKYVTEPISNSTLIIWSTKQTLLSDKIKSRGYYDEVWFSVPYLTEDQLKVWSENNWN